jgi:hypothetical protein
MKFRNRWIDPRIVQVRPEAAQAYLLAHDWKPLGPAANPDLLMFAGPGAGSEAPTVLVPAQVDDGPLLQRMIDLVGDLAAVEDRWAVDVLNDILRQQVQPAPANGPSVPTRAALA